MLIDYIMYTSKKEELISKRLIIWNFTDILNVSEEYCNSTVPTNRQCYRLKITILFPRINCYLILVIEI